MRAILEKGLDSGLPFQSYNWAHASGYQKGALDAGLETPIPLDGAGSVFPSGSRRCGPSTADP